MAVVAAEPAAQRRPVPGAGGTAVRAGVRGQHARQQRVVDALAGQRVDQAGGVADEQHPAVGLEARAGGQRQVVAAHGARLELLVRELLGQPLQELTPREPAAAVEDPVAEVRPAVGERERPGVGRAAPAGRTRSPARPGRRQRRWCTRGWRPRSWRRAHGGGASCPPHRRVRPVGTDDDAGRDLPVEHDVVGALLHPPDAVPAELRTAGDGRVDDRGVEHGARDDAVRPGAVGGDRAAAGRAHLQPRTAGGRDSVRSTPSASSRSSAGAATPSPQVLSRGKAAASSSTTRASGRTCSTRSAVAAPAGPAPTIATSASPSTRPSSPGSRGGARPSAASTRLAGCAAYPCSSWERGPPD